MRLVLAGAETLLKRPVSWPILTVMRLDPTLVLTDCCKLKTPARIVLNGLICRGRFAAASRSEVVFDLLVEAKLGHSLFPHESVGSVIFSYRSNTQVFLACVKDYNDAESAPQLSVERLSDIAGGERRRARRVPVDGNSGLRVALKTKDDKVWVVRVVDISMTGMLIEFPEGSDPDFELREPLGVELQLDDHIARITGQARHQGAQSWGVLFLGVNPSDSLRVIVNSLEWDWLRQNSGDPESSSLSSPVLCPSVLTTPCRLPLT